MEVKITLDGDLPALQPHIAKIAAEEIQNASILLLPVCARCSRRMGTSLPCLRRRATCAI